MQRLMARVAKDQEEKEMHPVDVTNDVKGEMDKIRRNIIKKQPASFQKQGYASNTSKTAGGNASWQTMQSVKMTKNENNESRLSMLSHLASLDRELKVPESDEAGCEEHTVCMSPDPIF